MIIKLPDPIGDAIALREAMESIQVGCLGLNNDNSETIYKDLVARRNYYDINIYDLKSSRKFKTNINLIEAFKDIILCNQDLFYNIKNKYELEEESVDLPGQFIACDIWANWAEKRPNPDKLINTLYKIRDKSNLPLIFLGAYVKDASGEMRGERKYDVIDLVGKTNIKQIIYIIKRASLYIGPDSGLMRFATYFNINSLIISMSTTPEWTRNKNYLSADLPCIGCYNRGIVGIKENSSPRCPYKIKCSNEWNEDLLIEKSLFLLKEKETIK